MDDPDQTAPAPRDDGSVPPKRASPREIREMMTPDGRDGPAIKTPAKAPEKAIKVEDLNAANDE